MKIFNNKKQSFFIALIVSTLMGCGSSDDNVQTNEANTPPSHGGDITITKNEKDDFSFVYLLGTPTGANAGDGIAIDMDGDVIFVDNLSTNLTDMTGFEIVGGRLGVRPSELIDSLNTGDTLSLVLNYDVSDGQLSAPRTATVNIVGEDFAPEFDEDITQIYSKFDISSEFDLLSGVTDADGDELSVSNVVLDGTAPQGLLSTNGSTLTVDVPIIADSIAIGDNRSFAVTYNVVDQNNSLPRSLTIDIRGVRLEPVEPIVSGPQTVSVSTSGERTTTKLDAEPAVIDENGDSLTVDFDSLMPRTGSPDLSFSNSVIENNELIFDPVVFGPFVANGATETFVYDYQVSDGEFTVDASVEITIVNDGIEQALSNGSFEDGLTGWTVANNGASVGTTSDIRFTVIGNNFLDFSAPDTVRTNLNNLEVGATYVLEARVSMGDPWSARSSIAVFGETLGEDGIVNPDTLLNKADTFNHGNRDRTYALAFTATENNYLLITNVQANMNIDDLRLYKIEVDQAINLINENNSNLNNGIGDWQLGSGATFTMDGIDGTGSINSGTEGDKRHILSLGSGAIETGKTYVLLLDIERATDQRAQTFRASLVDDADPSSETTISGGAQRSIHWISQDKMRFVSVFDTTRHNSITDWETREMSLHIGTNVWGQGNTYIIDNIQLIELP